MKMGALMATSETKTLEVRYLSMSHTHLQFEYTDEFGDLEEAWIPFTAIKNIDDMNIFDPIMELEILVSALDKEGIFV